MVLTRASVRPAGDEVEKSTSLKAKNMDKEFEIVILSLSSFCKTTYVPLQVAVQACPAHSVVHCVCAIRQQK
jgi:hypothetical protein